MNPRQLFAAAAILWIAFVPATAQLAGTYEPFTHQANAESWIIYDYADEGFYIPAWDSAGDGQDPEIYFTFAGANALDFVADELSSGGAFTGDLSAAGVDAIGCDIFVEDIESFDVCEFFLFSTADNRYYLSEWRNRGFPHAGPGGGPPVTGSRPVKHRRDHHRLPTSLEPSRCSEPPRNLMMW